MPVSASGPIIMTQRAMIPTVTTRPVATFSIVAMDLDTGELGVAVQSKYFAVGAVVPWAAGGVGAIATQSWANTDYGPDGLSLLEDDYTAGEVIDELVNADADAQKRQVGVVDSDGRVASYTGNECQPWAGATEGDGFTVQGNLLAGPGVIAAMASAYEARSLPLAERLVAALQAGQRAGGDKRGQQSAALIVVHHDAGRPGFNDRLVDLRVDDHVAPIGELERLLGMHRKFHA